MLAMGWEGLTLGFSGVLVLVALGWAGLTYLEWVTTNFVITTDRLIYRHGVLAKHGIEIPLDRVNTVFFSQSILERMVGSGDLVIESAGEMGRQNFSNVRKPSAVQNEIYKQMEANENRKFDRVNRSAPAPAAGVHPRPDRQARPAPPAGRPHPGRVRRQEAAAPRPHVISALGRLSCHQCPIGRRPRWRATPWLAVLSHDGAVEGRPPGDQCRPRRGHGGAEALAAVGCVGPDAGLDRPRGRAGRLADGRDLGRRPWPPPTARSRRRSASGIRPPSEPDATHRPRPTAGRRSAVGGQR